MTAKARILVVDDVPNNVKLLADLLAVRGYEVLTACDGDEALERVKDSRPDLVLLDVMMPRMNGYDTCRAIRADPATGILPIVMVTALDPAGERIKGIEAGADDFLTKPINVQELLARVKSLLRVQSLFQEVARQKSELAEWNRTLEARVAEQVAQVERLSRLRRFLSPKVADLIVAGRLDDPLATRRREVVIVFVDLRGFTAFTETADPEEVFAVLRAYHAGIGRLIARHEGTIEHFAGDGVMIVFNDPAPLPDPAFSAVSFAIDARDAVAELAEGWKKRGYGLGCGVGIAQGYATIGTIGYEGRYDYGTIGTVANLAARLCGEAKAGEILVARKVHGLVEDRVLAGPSRDLALRGFHEPVAACSVIGRKEGTS
ncbi:MAG TPA: response regulator [Usitatibacteraceae bacterium]|nr:response regulator [Usitatibacteraceae bacterium]